MRKLLLGLGIVLGLCALALFWVLQDRPDLEDWANLYAEPAYGDGPCRPTR